MGCCGSCGGEKSTPPKEQKADQSKEQAQATEQKQAEAKKAQDKK